MCRNPVFLAASMPSAGNIRFAPLNNNVFREDSDASLEFDHATGDRADYDDRDCASVRRLALSRPEGAMDARNARYVVRSQQAPGPRPTGAADGRVSGDLRGEPARARSRCPTDLARTDLSAARHAGDDDGLPADGNHRDAARNLYPDRLYPRVPAAHLHRWPDLAQRGRARLRRLFHRQVDR